MQGALRASHFYIHINLVARLQDVMLDFRRSQSAVKVGHLPLQRFAGSVLAHRCPLLPV